MRKITQESIDAFNHHLEFNKSNTRVFYDRYNNGYTTLSLHGNNIARIVVWWKIEITTAWWGTKTTKERLRGIPWVNSLTTKKGKLYLNGKEWDGEWITI